MAEGQTESSISAQITLGASTPLCVDLQSKTDTVAVTTSPERVDLPVLTLIVISKTIMWLVEVVVPCMVRYWCLAGFLGTTPDITAEVLAVVQ
jgi:hypothetical protein